MKEIVKIVLTICLSVVITLSIIHIMNNLGVDTSDFSITSFNLDSEKSNYTSIENYYTYEGEGILTCSDSKNDYLVELEMTNKIEKETNHINVLVHAGKGTFMTYDKSYDLTNSSKPDYEFKVIGFVKIDK